MDPDSCRQRVGDLQAKLRHRPTNSGCFLASRGSHSGPNSHESPGVNSVHIDCELRLRRGTLPHSDVSPWTRPPTRRAGARSSPGHGAQHRRQHSAIWAPASLSMSESRSRAALGGDNGRRRRGRASSGVTICTLTCPMCSPAVARRVVHCLRTATSRGHRGNGGRRLVGTGSHRGRWPHRSSLRR
jgi:hypothetical protein